jgi:hypothetical protein
MAVASNPSPELTLTTLDGDSRPLSQWLTTFHLGSVILDPYTNESSWVLKSAVRILDGFRGSAVRVNFVVTSPADEARTFLGPIADDFLVFCDPERTLVKSLALASLPAFVFIRSDGTVPASAEGWSPGQWKQVAASIATTTAWSHPTIPVASDPGPFHGTPALG